MLIIAAFIKTTYFSDLNCWSDKTSWMSNYDGHFLLIEKIIRKFINNEIAG